LKDYLLNNKVKEPSRSIDLISIKEQLENIQRLITNANEQVKEHNTIVANYTTEREGLIKSIWKYLVEENKLNIIDFNKKSNDLQRGIDALEKQRQDLLSKHASLNNKIKDANKRNKCSAFS